MFLLINMEMRRASNKMLKMREDLGQHTLQTLMKHRWSRMILALLLRVGIHLLTPFVHAFLGHGISLVAEAEFRLGVKMRMFRVIQLQFATRWQ